MAVFTPTGCPKSVRNVYVIEDFGGFFCCQYGLEFFVDVRAFVIGLLQICSFSLSQPSQGTEPSSPYAEWELE